MVITAVRTRAATGIGAMVALLLVAIFGSPMYVRWVEANTHPDSGGGLFLRTLAWPRWSLNPNMAVRDVLADDLKAILLVVFVVVFLALLAGAELGGALGAVFSGWAAVIFAGALAGLVASFVAVSAGPFTALTWALGGAGYGLLVGWIVGFAQLGAGRRSVREV